MNRISRLVVIAAALAALAACGNKGPLVLPTPPAPAEPVAAPAEAQPAKAQPATDPATPPAEEPAPPPPAADRDGNG
jgi:diaminopimelate decarboxylase